MSADFKALRPWLILMELVLTVFLTVIFLPSPGTPDVKTWLAWQDNVVRLGLRTGFAVTQDNYPPLTFVIFDAVARASRPFHLDPFLALKLSLGVFLLAMGVVLFSWTRDALLTLTTVLAAILNSMALGYGDIYFASTLLLSLWALEAGNLLLFTLLYAVTCLIKFQSLIIAPFLLIYLFKQANLRRLALSVVLPALSCAAFTLLVFGFPVVQAFRLAFSHPYVSGNALNFNWIITYGLHLLNPSVFGGLPNGVVTYIETYDWHIVLWPKLVFFGLYAIAALAFMKHEKTLANLLRYSLAGYLAYFMFNTGVHENHLFLPAILAAILFWKDRTQAATFVTCSLAANINLIAFYGLNGRARPYIRIMGIDATVLLAALNVGLFAAYYLAAIKHNGCRRVPMTPA